MQTASASSMRFVQRVNPCKLMDTNLWSCGALRVNTEAGAECTTITGDVVIAGQFGCGSDCAAFKEAIHHRELLQGF